MELSQKFTNTTGNNSSNLQDVTNDELTYKQNMFIDLMAFGSIEVDIEGRVRQIPMTELAQRIGVTRQTLYNWRESIPDYAERIRARRYEKFKTQIEDTVWRGVMLRAFKGEKPQAEMILSHFGDYVPPTQQVKVDTTDNISDLFNLLRERKENRPNVVDAEVVHNPVETVQNPETQQAPVIDNLPAPADPPSVSDQSPDRIVPANLPTATHFDPPQPKNPNEWA